MAERNQDPYISLDNVELDGTAPSSAGCKPTILLINYSPIKCPRWELNPQNRGSEPRTYSNSITRACTPRGSRTLKTRILSPVYMPFLLPGHMAGRLGFEPRPRILEIRMLPLHYQPRWEVTSLYFYQHKFLFEHDS